MHEDQKIVINTGPIIALVAGLGDLQILKMYRRVCVPFEVSQELLVDGAKRFAAEEFDKADWLERHSNLTDISSYLRNSLDRGEAAVIQLALDEGIDTVCIDEVPGRRVARLHGLKVTGSIGVLLRAKREGRLISMREVIEKMESQGVWLSEKVKCFALQKGGEL